MLFCRSFMTPTTSVFNCRSWIDLPASLLCKLFEVSRSTRPHWKRNFIKTLVPQEPINALTQDSLFNVYVSMSGHGNLCMWVQVPPRVQKRVSDSLELQAVRSCLTWMLGNELGSYARCVCLLPAEARKGHWVSEKLELQMVWKSTQCSPVL